MKRPSLLRVSLAALCAAATLPSANASEEDPPVEFGKVTWERDFDTGMRRAKELDKPALILFQEVPG